MNRPHGPTHNPSNSTILAVKPSQTPLRIAVIGAGLGAPPHLKSLQDLADQVDLAWLVGRDSNRLAKVATPSNTRKTTRLDEVLQDTSVQAALVLTPPNTHLDIVQQLARAGKHVLVEKPLEVTVERSQALVQICEAHGVLLAVMLQHRLRAGAMALKALIEQGQLGQIISAHASIRWWRPQSYYDEPGRGTWHRDGGGVLITQAIHTIDLLMHLIGKPQQVTGLVSTSPLHQMECEDCAAALLHYPGGAMATVQATTAAYPGYPERIEINGSLGSATLESGTLQLQFMDGESRRLGERQTGGAGADPMAFDHGPHRNVIEDFMQAIRSGRATQISGRSALAVHQVIDAIVRSSQTGLSVAV